MKEKKTKAKQEWQRRSCDYLILRARSHRESVTNTIFLLLFFFAMAVDYMEVYEIKYSFFSKFLLRQTRVENEENLMKKMFFKFNGENMSNSSPP